MGWRCAPSPGKQRFAGSRRRRGCRRGLCAKPRGGPSKTDPSKTQERSRPRMGPPPTAPDSTGSRPARDSRSTRWRRSSGVRKPEGSSGRRSRRRPPARRARGNSTSEFGEAPLAAIPQLDALVRAGRSDTPRRREPASGHRRAVRRRSRGAARRRARHRRAGPRPSGIAPRSRGSRGTPSRSARPSDTGVSPVYRKSRLATARRPPRSRHAGAAAARTALRDRRDEARRPAATNVFDDEVGGLARAGRATPGRRSRRRARETRGPRRPCRRGTGPPVRGVVAESAGRQRALARIQRAAASASSSMASSPVTA